MLGRPALIRSRSTRIPTRTSMNMLSMVYVYRLHLLLRHPITNFLTILRKHMAYRKHSSMVNYNIVNMRNGNGFPIPFH